MPIETLGQIIRIPPPDIAPQPPDGLIPNLAIALPHAARLLGAPNINFSDDSGYRLYQSKLAEARDNLIHALQDGTNPAQTILDTLDQAIAFPASEKAAEITLFTRLEQNGWYEGLDLPKIEEDTGFDKKDITVLLAGNSPEHMDTAKDSLRQYGDLRDAFFNDTSNPEAFKRYAACLLSLMYGENAHEAIQQFDQFISSGKSTADWAYTSPPRSTDELGQDVTYQLYVDKSGGDFDNLKERLAYLRKLGVTNTWILPFFTSPRIDDGFDVADRRAADPRYGGNEAFKRFIDRAKENGIRIMFDQVFNHDSYLAKTFQAAIDSSHPLHERYKNWYIFREGTRDEPPPDPAYQIFKGVKTSPLGQEIFPIAGSPKETNWMWVEPLGTWVFCNFYPQMVDRNYDNPEVMMDELDILKYWGDFGEGANSYFRYDAAKHTVKKDSENISPESLAKYPALGTLIEKYKSANLPQSHLILRLLRAYAQHRYNGHVRIVAEVWDDHETVKKYFGPKGEEANDQFGFTLMEAYILSIVHRDSQYLSRAIENVSGIPPGCRYFDFSRHHDAVAGNDSAENRLKWKELGEYLQYEKSTAERLQDEYGIDTSKGKTFEGGLATRLANLLMAVEKSKDKNVLLKNHALMLSLVMFSGSMPMFYAGDEYLQEDIDENIFDETGGIDPRRLFRGSDPWQETVASLENPASLKSKAFAQTQKMIALRKSPDLPALWRGRIIPLASYGDDKTPNTNVFTAMKKDENPEGSAQTVLMAANLSRKNQTVRIEVQPGSLDNEQKLTDLLTTRTIKWQREMQEDREFLVFPLQPKQSAWIIG